MYSTLTITEFSEILEISEIPEIPEISEILEISDIPEISEILEIPEISEISEISYTDRWSQMIYRSHQRNPKSAQKRGQRKASKFEVRLTSKDSLIFNKERVHFS